MQEAALIWSLILLVLCGLLASLVFYLFQFKKRLAHSEAEAVLREQQLNSELSDLKNKLTQELLYDAVTGLPSFAVFKEQVQFSIKQSQRYNTIFGLLFIDLKNFRVINNTLGYDRGDLLLKEVAKRLQASIRQVDSVCRFSGDTFVVLLSKLSHPESATLVVHRFSQKLAELFYVDQHFLSIPARVGIAVYPLDGEDVDTLLKNAGNALSQVKAAGPQQYQFYHKEMHDQSERELLLNSALSRESFFEELLIEYQPQIDVSHDTVFGWEVLLRWQHPELGLVPAREFIQLAINMGKIEAIGEWVFQRVCQQLQRWRLSGYQLPPLSINVSLQQLESPHFISMILRILQETQVDPRLLSFEISENDLLKNRGRSEKIFSILHRLGIRMAIDHFAVGDTLLMHLKNLPVDYLKISSRFVRDLGSNSEAETIVNTMLVLIHSLGKSVIALGVETELQKQILEKLGCQLMQGHFFSLPLSEKEVTKHLRLSTAKPVQEADLTVS